MAQAQLAHGADGLTAATVAEVEALARAGAKRLLMAYPLVGEGKIRRIAALPADVEIAVSIDSVEGAEAVGRHFAALGREIDLYLLIDSGMRRAGVDPADAPTIGAAIGAVEGVRLRGVLTHEGTVYGAADAADIVARTEEVARFMVAAADGLRAAGLPIDSVSLGASSSARAAARCAGVTQIRPGSYAFNDLSQVGLDLVDPSRCAARVVATVISNAAPDRACIDAGSKTLSKDPPPGRRPQEPHPGYGSLVGLPGWRLANLSEEHGWLRWVGDAAPTPLTVGQRVEVIPNHICTAFSNAGQSIGLRDGAIEGIWPVIPRGEEPLAPASDA